MISTVQIYTFPAKQPNKKHTFPMKTKVKNYTFPKISVLYPYKARILTHKPPFLAKVIFMANRKSLALSPRKWVESTNAIDIKAISGRYGGTDTVSDIAFEFAPWVSVEFKLYLVREFQCLKADEQKQLAWSTKRELSKINYRIHTDAIKVNLIPAEVTREQAALKYADEADVLNIAMFGITARQWREQNPDKKGNIRDYASINELICLSNMENLNAVFINDGMPQSKRLIKLNQIAIQQMKILEDTGGRNLLQ